MSQKIMLSTKWVYFISFMLLGIGCNTTDSYIAYRLTHRGAYYQEHLVHNRIGEDGLKFNRNEEYQIEYKYPRHWSNWATVPNLKKGLLGYLHDNSLKNEHKHVFSIWADSELRETSLNQIQDKTFQSLKPDVLITEKGPITVSGYEGFYFIFRAPSADKKTYFKAKEIVVKRSDKIFHLHFWAIESDYEASLADANTVFNSFKIG